MMIDERNELSCHPDHDQLMDVECLRREMLFLLLFLENNSRTVPF